MDGKKGYTKGIVTKDEYTSTLHSYQNVQDETKSGMRDLVVHLTALAKDNPGSNSIELHFQGCGDVDIKY